jgi:hypothetical protein
MPEATPSRPKRSNAVGAWILLAVLLLLLALAVYILISGWSAAGDASTEISAAGWVAMGFGILATLGLGIGLMALIFYSNRRP